MFNFEFLLWFLLMGTTLRAAPSKSYTFSTNYHACIAMSTWRRCESPILFWPWPQHNLLSRLDFLRRSSLMDTTLRAARDKSYAFSTNYHAYIEIPTWYTCTHTSILFDLHKFMFLLRSREATCPPRIAGAGQPCYDRSLFFVFINSCLFPYHRFFVIE